MFFGAQFTERLFIERGPESLAALPQQSHVFGGLIPDGMFGAASRAHRFRTVLRGGFLQAPAKHVIVTDEIPYDGRYTLVIDRAGGFGHCRTTIGPRMAL